ncbi:hypothetical protein VI817_008522 [Penicillium citrinum]|nr:hypothetical protein VI817_008522 [Penicillium citrinum]
MRALSREGEFPTDQYLIGQVRLQHLLERVDPLVRRGFGEGQVMPQDVEAMIRSLKGEANECKAQLSLSASRDVTIGLQSHSFEIHLYQTTLFDVFPSSTESIDQTTALYRIDTLCHGLAAARQFINFYHALPHGIEKNFSFLHWISAGFCLAASCKLALASLEPSVRYHEQVNGLRDTLNMQDELRKFVQRMNLLDKECKGGKWEQHEIFFYQHWLQNLSEWFEGQYRLAHSDSAGPNDNGMTFATTGISENNIYEETDPGFSWLDLHDVTIEEMLNAWLGPGGLPTYPRR